MCTALLTIFSSVARGDVVELRNGDLVRGKILRMEDEKLELETDFAGVIRINWGKISRIVSDRPLILTFYATAEVPEGTGIRDGDRLIVSSLSADGPIPLSHIKAIGETDLYYRGNINLGGNQTSGNAEATAAHVSGSFTLRSASSRLETSAKYNRGAAGDTLTAENGSGSLRYLYFLDRHWVALGDQLLEHDRFQDLNLRSTSTAGLGYNFYDKRSRTLLVGAGTTAVYQDFSTQPATLTPALTWMVRWYWESSGGDVKLFHDHQAFRDVGQSSAFRINASQGIRVRMYGDLSVNIEYDFRYNSQPAPGRQKVDTIWIVGLSYEFKR